MKLGQADIETAAAHLRKLRDRIDPVATGAPVTLAVITGAGFSYTRQDGVAVVAAGALVA